jgi:two-component system, LytTR family, sensor kinase
MEIAHLIIPVVSSVVGMTLSLLLVVLLHKQPARDACCRKIGTILGVSLFAMYFGISGRIFCKIYGLTEHDWFFRLSTILMMSLAPFLPFFVLLSWRVSTVLQWKTRFTRMMVAFAGTSALGIFTYYFRTGFEASVTNQRVSQLLALNILICFLPAVISIARSPLDPRLRSFIKVTCAINIIGAIVVVFASLVNSTVLTRMNTFWSSFVVLLRLMTLVLGLLGSFIAAARFRLVDVFVRWSTRITVLGALSIVVTLSFTSVAIDVTPSGRGVGLLACAFEMIVTLLMGITLSEKCERWVESRVLQRADLKTVEERLRGNLFTLERKENLFMFLEEELVRSLNVREVRVLPLEIIPHEALELQKAGNEEPLEIPEQIAPLSVGTLRDIDFLIPVPLNGKIEEMIGISTGTGRRPLHSGEIHFLSSAGHQLGVRLHLLEVEAASRRQALRESLLRQQLTEAELRALRAQVNPHFLFNSLNTIADLIVRNPINAEHMTIRLSSVFRHVLAQADRQFVTLAEEFNFLRNYLGIEQERFGENLQVFFEMDPEVAQVAVPTLLLQPLVENALKHGLAPKGGKRSLRIVAAGSMERVCLDVIDNGIGFPSKSTVPLSSRSRSSGVGLANTRARLKAVYGDKGRLFIESAPMQGSRVSVSLPLKEVTA